MPDTYDTYIELLPEADQLSTRKTYHYGFQKHIAIKGFQKLINKWTKHFLTTEGTHPSDRTYGTRVPLLIGSNVQSRRDILDVVQLAVAKTNSKIRSIQSAYPSEDPRELLDDATLDALEFSSDLTGIEIYVRIRNQANEVLRVSLPPISTSES